MKYLKTMWIRIVISLILGGMSMEVIFLLSGDPYRNRSADDPNFSIGFAVVFYFILTGIVKLLGRNNPKF